MSDQWFIYQDGDSKSSSDPLGPFNSQEIRELMRSGEVDPFDLVCRQGSHIKRALVEVDEIFAPEGKKTHDSKAHDPRTPSPREHTQIAKSHNPHPPQAAPQSVPKSPPRWHRPPAKKKKVPDERAKKFFLIDSKKKLLGPLSATEIQSLFLKGILKKKSWVQKRGSSAKVPIEKFVEVYHKASLSLPNRGALPATPVLQKIAMRQALSRKTRRPTQSISISSAAALMGVTVVFMLGIFFIGFSILEVWKHSLESQSPLHTPPISHEGQKEQGVPEIGRDQKKPQKQPVKKIEAKKRSPSYASRKTPTPKVRRTARRFSSSQPSPSAVIPQGPFMLSQVSQLRGKDGQSVRIGPLSFDLQTLGACISKCNVVFTDSSGGILLVKFFKAPFFQKLLSTRGRASLQGRISQNGKVLYLRHVFK